MAEDADFYALITGANSGLGFSIAHRLVCDFLDSRPASQTIAVVITTRTSSKAAATTAALRKVISQTHSSGSTRVFLHSAVLDLTDVSSVSKAAFEINATYPKLNSIILNAGMGTFAGLDHITMIKQFATDFVGAQTYPKFKKQAEGVLTKDGMGLTFAANCFGHYFLAHELMGLLQNADGGGRVIWQSSLEAYESAFSLDDLQGIKATAPYEQSKRIIDVLSLSSSEPYAKPWFTTQVNLGSQNEHKQNVRCYLAHPGICATSIFTTNFILHWGQILINSMARWLGSPWHLKGCYQGALPVVWLSLASDEELFRSDAGKIKWGAASHRSGREYLKSTPVEGLGNERWDSVARETYAQMEALRKEWKVRLSAGNRTDQKENSL